ncbi:hypothetical protein VTK73DRAFT_3482 [Phialemonium thermophilum]|uniref:GPI ethanolamine phosphate transferase 1 n=1 Tax=Phialemonium thermophilum TaxID=223376 RepID=A0ABR3VHW6_9PEZI
MSTFTLLPALKTENMNLILLGGAAMVAVGIAYLVFEDYILADFGAARRAPPRRNHVARALVGVQTGLTVLAMIVTRSSALSLQAKQGLPRGNQVVGWLVLVVSLLMPLAYRMQPNHHYMHKLVVMFLTCAPTFVILTISYEGLFYLAFSATLVCWVRLEHAIYTFGAARSRARPKNPPAHGSASDRLPRADASPSEKQGPAYRPLTLDDTRVALFFFVLLQSAFFSTGNVASVSSFSLESVNRLVPVFDPLSQGAMLVLKLLIPFALISANLGVLNRRLGVAPSALFMVVMALSDGLTLYFFWVVRDEGSWLEIGSTISHFVIASGLCVFVAALEGVSSLFIAGMEVDDAPVAEAAPGQQQQQQQQEEESQQGSQQGSQHQQESQQKAAAAAQPNGANGHAGVAQTSTEDTPPSAR